MWEAIVPSPCCQQKCCPLGVLLMLPTINRGCCCPLPRAAAYILEGLLPVLLPNCYALPLLLKGKGPYYLIGYLEMLPGIP